MRTDNQVQSYHHRPWQGRTWQCEFCGEEYKVPKPALLKNIMRQHLNSRRCAGNEEMEDDDEGEEIDRLDYRLDDFQDNRRPTDQSDIQASNGYNRYGNQEFRPRARDHSHYTHHGNRNHQDQTYRSYQNRYDRQDRHDDSTNGRCSDHQQNNFSRWRSGGHWGGGSAARFACQEKRVGVPRRHEEDLRETIGQWRGSGSERRLTEGKSSERGEDCGSEKERRKEKGKNKGRSRNSSEDSQGVDANRVDENLVEGEAGPSERGNTRNTPQSNTGNELQRGTVVVREALEAEGPGTTQPVVLSNKSWVSSNIKRMWETMVFSDMTIVVEGGTKRFPCHRAIVMTACTNLNDPTPTVEGAQEKGKEGCLCVNADWIKGPTMEQVLLFIYKGECTLSELNITNMLEVADWLGIWDLTELCMAFCRDHLVVCKRNCCQIFEDGVDKNLAVLVQKCLEYFSKEFHVVTTDESFLVLGCKALLALTQMAEASLFPKILAVIQWYQHDSESRKPFARNLLLKLGFDGLSSDELAQLVTHELVSESNYLRDLAWNALHTLGQQKRPFWVLDASNDGDPESGRDVVQKVQGGKPDLPLVKDENGSGGQENPSTSEEATKLEV